MLRHRQEWRRLELDTNPTTLSPPFLASTSTTQPVMESGKKFSAKARLHNLCAAMHWKQPLFELCNEEGPAHYKMFTFKVVLHTQEGAKVLECFGNPCTSKKAAAENAAEGAMWLWDRLLKE